VGATTVGEVEVPSGIVLSGPPLVNILIIPNTITMTTVRSAMDVFDLADLRFGDICLLLRELR
jgi:hypothetical protein